MTGATRRTGLALAALFLLAVPVRSQISPGPLSRAHARLEGSTHCLDCHDPSQGAASPKCLACHDALRARIDAGRGLHARPDHGECRKCHVEHQGEEYELVWWGKAGRASFDHDLTGHVLDGAHRRVACDRCHVPPVGPAEPASGRATLAMTYLGLETACASCHLDEHRGQLDGRSCDACHTQDTWTPAPGFDHARMSWPLSGRHAAVRCERCHTTRKPDPARPTVTFQVFRGVSTDCASCHEDTHRGRLGVRCETCHSTASWRGARTDSFDHARTDYPLEGRHAAVTCESCHARGQPLRLAHARCLDCHADVHAGQLAHRTDGGRCESCHDVAGFRPARFGLAEHATTAYPLAGAHLAVACDRCHRAAVPPGDRAGKAAVQLHLTATRCSECHRDPHGTGVARLVAADGCEGCHQVESWRTVEFDHARTTYPLTGRHSRVGCTDCHGEDGVTGPGDLRFAGVARTCEGCHDDPHQGQLERDGLTTACDRCHTTDDLQATRFDHDRDSDYRLDGAHARLACAACHRRETRGERSVVRYRPLPTTCSGCHGPGRRPAQRRTLMRRSILVAVALLLSSALLLPGQDASDEPHGDLTLDCGECHNPEQWLPVEKPPTFRHDTTGFTLKASHTQVSCRRCHQSLVFHQVGTACADCHQDAHRGELGFRCESCHTPATWTNQREMFQAHSATRFPLLAVHARLDCAACHADQRPWQYATTPAECGNCHLETYLQTTDPSHVEAGFSRRCEDCHLVTASTWRGRPLLAPRELPPRRRPRAARLRPLPHRRELRRPVAGPARPATSRTTPRPPTRPRAPPGFPTTCESCHTIQAWRPATFDHDLTRFPLDGRPRRRWTAPGATKAGATRERPPTASPATSPTTPAPPTPTTRLPDSRPSATAVTTPAPGARPTSTTTRPASP